MTKIALLRFLSSQLLGICSEAVKPVKETLFFHFYNNLKLILKQLIFFMIMKKCQTFVSSLTYTIGTVEPC